MGNSLETTRAPVLSCVSRWGRRRSLELVRNHMVTTSAGLRSTRRALPSTMLTRSASPRLRMRSRALRTRSGMSSTPRARAEMLRRGDDHPAIAASQVVHHLAGLNAAGLEHTVNQVLGSGDGGPEI